MANSLFYKIFPVPKTMNMVGAGIDISETAVRFVQFDFSKEDAEMKKHGTYPIPEGVFLDKKIKNAEPIKKILQQIKKEHGIVFAHAAVPESEAYLSAMDIPLEAAQAARESIEIQFEEYIPIKVGESVFDYERGRAKTTRGTSGQVFVTAAPERDVASLVDIFSSAGISLLSLEMEAQAVARAAVSGKNEGTMMVVSLYPEKIEAYIVSGGVVEFVSGMDVAAKDFLIAMEKELNMTTEEAKNFCEKFQDGEDPKEEISRALAGVFGRVAEEVNSHFLFWNAKRGAGGRVHEKIEKIILCGPGAAVPGLAGYLSSRLRVPAEYANVWGNVFSFDNYIPPMSFCESLKYATAIGLALYLKES